MNPKFKNLLKVYSILFLVSIFLSFFFKIVTVPKIVTIAFLAYTILLILFSTVLLISKTKKEKFVLISLIFSIVINVLNFINIFNQVVWGDILDFKYMTIKLISAFFILLIYIKISGRKQLAPISPSDQISNMVIGALVGSTIISSDVSILESIVIVFIWAMLQILIRHLKYRSSTVTNLLDGESYDLMKNTVINPHAFESAKISIMDFENNIHSQGIKSISQIKNARFEPSGNITIDLKTEKAQSNVLMFNGSINEEKLFELNIKKENIKKILTDNNFTNFKEIFCIEYYDEKLYIYTKDGTTVINNIF